MDLWDRKWIFETGSEFVRPEVNFWDRKHWILFRVNETIPAVWPEEGVNKTEIQSTYALWSVLNALIGSCEYPQSIGRNFIKYDCLDYNDDGIISQGRDPRTSRKFWNRTTLSQVHGSLGEGEYNKIWEILVRMGSIEPGTRSKVPDDVRRVFEEYDIDNGKLTKSFDCPLVRAR